MSKATWSEAQGFPGSGDALGPLRSVLSWRTLGVVGSGRRGGARAVPSRCELSDSLVVSQVREAHAWVLWLAERPHSSAGATGSGAMRRGRNSPSTLSSGSPPRYHTRTPI